MRTESRPAACVSGPCLPAVSLHASERQPVRRVPPAAAEARSGSRRFYLSATGACPELVATSPPPSFFPSSAWLTPAFVCSCSLPTGAKPSRCWEPVAPYRGAQRPLPRAVGDTGASADSDLAHPFAALADASCCRQQQLEPGPKPRAQSLAVVRPQPPNLDCTWHPAFAQHELRQLARHEPSEPADHRRSGSVARWNRRHVAREHSRSICRQGLSRRRPRCERPWPRCHRISRHRCQRASEEAGASAQCEIAKGRSSSPPFAISPSSPA